MPRARIDRGAARVFDEIERIGDVDVRWLAVGQNDDEFPETAGVTD